MTLDGSDPQTRAPPRLPPEAKAGLVRAPYRRPPIILRGSGSTLLSAVGFLLEGAARLPERPPRGASAIRPSLPMREAGKLLRVTIEEIEGLAVQKRGHGLLPPLRASAPALANISSARAHRRLWRALKTSAAAL
jgi:hypothetical protein